MMDGQVPTRANFYSSNSECVFGKSSFHFHEVKRREIHSFGKGEGSFSSFLAEEQIKRREGKKKKKVTKLLSLHFHILYHFSTPSSHLIFSM